MNSLTPFIDKISEEKNINLFNQKGPYYTSYPTLGLWSTNNNEKNYRQDLEKFFSEYKNDTPLALYVHIPFCAILCYFCFCSVEITNKFDKKKKFTEYLLREIKMLKEFLNKRSISLNIKEIHLGGGTPSHLENEQLVQILEGINSLSNINNVTELAMEIDPRTTNKEKLKFYSSIGITRISFGIQDFNDDVQLAINRVQPYKFVKQLLSKEIRDLFNGVNFDLLYGLPKQTEETFLETLELVNKLSPERITLLKYAHLPHLKKNMSMIKESDMPSDQLHPILFCKAVEYFISHGYQWIGLDNFAKKNDTLALAANNKHLGRDFNGWTSGMAKNMIGLGPSTTSAFGNYYYQSFDGTKEYYQAIDKDEFPILRGFQMNNDDMIRREVIFELICNQGINFNLIEKRYKINFGEYFKKEINYLIKNFSEENMVEINDNGIIINYNGRFFARTISKVFDKYWLENDYEITGPVDRSKK